MDFTELILGLTDGSRVAVKCWGNEHSKTKILALHGWLDNASTWDPLARMLTGSPKFPNIRIVAMDFLGHGHSSHGHPSYSYSMAERVVEVIGVADALHWNSFYLMGHSMGAAVASLVAGTVPSRVEKLILVEGLGPFRPPATPPEQLEKAVKERPILLRRQRRVYSTFAAALERYMKNNPLVRKQSAEILVARGTEEVLVGGEGEASETGFCFRHDPRLVGVSLMSYSEKSVAFFIQRIACPVLVIFGDKPYIKDPTHLDPVTNMFNSRLEKLKNYELFHTEGHHHLHLDTPERIFDKVSEFLLTPTDKLVTQLKRGQLGAWAQPQQEQQRQQQLQPPQPLLQSKL